MDGAEGTENITKESEVVVRPEAGRNDGVLVIEDIAGSGKKVQRADYGREHSLNKINKTATNMPFSRAGLPDIRIQYQVCRSSV